MYYPRALSQTETLNLLVISGEHCGRSWGQIFLQLILSPSERWTNEVVNISLGNLLRSLVTEHHNQWDQILPQVEFSYNESPNRSTRKRPFQILYGMQPRGVSELRDLEQSEIRSIGVKYFAAEMQKLHSHIIGQLQSSSQEYKCRVDQHHREIQFEVGDQVLAHLRKERFPRGTYNKLKMNKIVPCKILKSLMQIL
jgi:hypothetical protein